MTGNCIRINGRDNVAIAVRDLQKGAEIVLADGRRPGIAVRQDTPQAHKIALTDIPKGGGVVRYGVVLGTMKEDMYKGGWINETNLQMNPAPDLDSMKFAVNLRTDLPDPPETVWEGYRNPGAARRVPGTCWGFRRPYSVPPGSSTTPWGASGGNCCPSTPMSTAW